MLRRNKSTRRTLQHTTVVIVGHRIFVVHVHVGVVLFDFIFHSIDVVVVVVVVVVLVHNRPFSGRRTTQGRGISKRDSLIVAIRSIVGVIGRGRGRGRGRSGIGRRQMVCTQQRLCHSNGCRMTSTSR